MSKENQKLLKRQRSGYMSNLTRLYNSIRKFMSDTDISSVKLFNDKIEKAFLAFVEAHQAYSEEIGIDYKEDATYKEREEEYDLIMKDISLFLKNCKIFSFNDGNNFDLNQFENDLLIEKKLLEIKHERELLEIKERFINKMKLTNHDLPLNFSINDNNISSTSSSFLEEFNKIAKTLAEGLSLPKLELKHFNGNAKDYIPFMNSFQNNVESVSDNYNKKLALLISNCTGVARDAIECTRLMPAQEGYIEAKRILKERFGQRYMIAKSYIEDVVSGEALRTHDNKGLFDLSSKMRASLICLKQMNFDSDLNSTDTLRKVMQRLPFNLKTQWVECVAKLRERDIEPDFEQMTLFLEKRSKVFNDPVFGDQLYTEKIVKPRFNTSYATISDNNRKTCMVCSLYDHEINNCSQFLKMSWDDKKNVLMKAGLCFNCLTERHITTNCPCKKQCTVEGCLEDRKHHSCMHYERKAIYGKQPAETNMSEAIDIVCFQILPIEVSNPCSKKSIKTYALLDNASDITLCTEELANFLDLPSVKTAPISLKTLSSTKTFTSSCVSCDIKGCYEEVIVKLNNIFTLKTNSITKKLPPTNEFLNKFDHLRDLKIEFLKDAKVTMLIGANRPELFVATDYLVGKSLNDPIAVHGPLGWSVLGGSKSIVNETFLGESSRDTVLNEQVAKFWEIDAMGLLCNEDKPISVDDKRALEIFDNSCVIEKNHYKIGLPWRKSDLILPNNKRYAEIRFYQLKKKLKTDNAFFEMYKKEINSYIDNGHAERVNSDMQNYSGKTWYLPHHGVSNPNKPGKLRVVFDCASRFKDHSLNSCLLSGPDITCKLFDVLLRFRVDQVCVMADIEGMFLQVFVKDEDCDSLRFLWFSDTLSYDSPIVEYKMLVHLFGATSSPSVASYALHRLINDFSHQFDSETLNTIKRNFYVDDMLKSVSSIKSAIEIVKSVSNLLQLGGFKIHKWISNKREVIQTIDPDTRDKTIFDMDFEKEPLPTCRTLGLKWNIDTDSFVYSASLKDNPVTKRGILSTLSSLYDPLGLVAPVTLLGKKIFQDTCRLKIGWDDPLDEKLCNLWLLWKNDLLAISKISIQRNFKEEEEVRDVQFHFFCDASESGLGVCSYVRIVSLQGLVKSKLVCSKSRLAPLKSQSIPRLELQAALLAARLYDSVRQAIFNELKPSKILFWTDSTAVLSFIKNESRRFKVFVANRVSEIRSLTEVDDWHYISTESNPADIASRGITAASLADNTLWFNGPKFLCMSEFSPPPLNPTFDNSEITSELKTDEKPSVLMVVEEDSSFQRFIKSYSSWLKLKVATAWLCRFKTWYISHRTKHSIRSIKNRRKVNNIITPNDLKNAGFDIILYVQSTELKDDNSVRRLDPIKVNGLVRVNGRLGMLNVAESMKKPIILPYKSHITDMIIREMHENNGHVGRNHLLSLIREEYWIIKGKSATRRVIANCVTCCRYNAKVKCQKMADLPLERLESQFPFQHTGMDFFGPFYVKYGRALIKRYVCIFTCLTIRAVHLEVCYDLSTNAFIQGLRRFIARRGRPSSLRSDNGTNFIGARNVLSLEIEKCKKKGALYEFLRKESIEWHFNTPMASHMGGVWERLIRSVRKIFNILMKDSVLTDESLQTLMAEVEHIMNSRPLTDNSEQCSDSPAITPNHILLGKASYNVPIGNSNQQNITHQWRQVQHLTEIFWRRFFKEYVLTLQNRSKWLGQEHNLEVGDVVLVVDEKIHRGKWPLGKVVQVRRSVDNLVRSAHVQTVNGIVVRPISKLCHLKML